MNLWSRIFGRHEPATKSLTLDQAVARYHAAQALAAAAGVAVTELQALRLSTVMACISRVASDVATMPMHVFRKTEAGKENADWTREYRLIMQKPNGWQTAFEFRQMMTAQAMLRGEGRALKIRDTQNNTRMLIPLPFSDVSVEWSGVSPTYTVSAYEGTISGRYARDDMVIIKRLPIAGREGLDTLMTGRDAIGLGIAAEATQARAFKNGTRMPGYWTTDETLGDEQVDRLAEQLLKATTGDNQYKSPILDSGLKYNKTGQSFEESQLIETRKHQMIEICASLGVLPAILGIDDKTQAFASVEAMFRAHLQHTLRPWLVAWEQALDRDLLDGEGPMFIKFDTTDMEKASAKEMAEALLGYVNTGTLSRNEVREVLGYDKKPGLDEHLTPLNMATGEGGESNA